MMTPSTRSPSMPMSLAYPTGSLREEFLGAADVRGGLAAREVDEASLDVGGDELDLHVITDVEPLDASHQPPLDRWLEDADPRALLGRARHQRVESLADPRGQEQRGGGLPHLPLDLRRVVLLLGAVASECVELTVAVRRGPSGDRRLEQPLRDEVRKAPVGRGGVHVI